MTQNMQTNASSNTPALNTGPLKFAGHANWIFRDDVTAAQIVISDTASPNPVRFINAFPEGNTGVLAFFHPLSDVLGVTLHNASSILHDDGQRGLAGTLNFDGDARLGQTILGSVRTIREVVEDGKSTNLVTRLGGYSPDSVWLTRTWLDGTVQYLGLFAGNNTDLAVQPSDEPTGFPSVNISRIDPGRNATVKFESTFNMSSSLRGLGMDDLFSSDGDPDIISAIRAAPQIVDQLAFLAYESQFLAGGWRFLTYFGRDTLLAMQVLLPVLSPQACEGILAGVIQRTGPDGELCHEETIGDYASILNTREGRPERGSAPVYDYKMVDTDFLLLPALAAYAERYPVRAKDLMARNSTLVPGTFGELVARNADRVLRLARPFAESAVKEHLIDLKAWPFGNWRDSAAGNGWGHYSFDVNCAMVPAALRAISDLAGTLLPAAGYDARAWADIWETEACKLFALPISSADAESRVHTYVRAANLTTGLLSGAGSLNGSTSSGWNDPPHVVGAGSPLYALALSDSAPPVMVQHSDLAFALLYSPSVPEGIIRATIEALQPYPRGLLTNVGMVVANAAYDPNAAPTTFANTAYHGAVVWSWQQAWMAAGIERQLRICETTKPPWCALAPALRQAQMRLWDAIAGAESVLWTEVWSPVLQGDRFAIGDLGAISTDGSEGDAVQLWSYTFLALRDARTGRPVAAGFEGV
ncbi:hypothetical protein CC85DRAFT_310507 [Cutaneotrichosporon oleaginosum]|uniref:Glycogen debranching enzyme n=1 Tax=Cutaneotrichosporon oleaginosum TaxID=879819 RepID=A0A0J1BCM9_9TREE|nr:uncharacterized protein CC85DRAFT_310507 [Cutaneotrichosporon oleaginosum]KLT45789.1 hypothetical protein CC85DRAFT_310507 [Cutaneotrichosporon oleaginosum]TXT04448.1 hypothetical protein COLE_07267 [Cutaneotrichosporon oleaginosum]